jgi:hypothetical protein
VFPEKLMRTLFVMKCPASWSSEIFVVFIRRSSVSAEASIDLYPLRISENVPSSIYGFVTHFVLFP